MLLDVNGHSRSSCVPIDLPIWGNHKGSVVVEPHFLQWIRNKDQAALRVDSREFIAVIKAYNGK